MTVTAVNARAAAAAAASDARPVICQVLHGLGIGGAEVLAVRMARRLRDQFRFVFACLDELGPLGHSLRSEGLPVHVLGRRPGIDWRCALRLSRVLERERVDLVHAHTYSPFFYAMGARLLCRRPSVLFTEHGRPYPDAPRRRRVWANRLLLERRDRVVGVGEAVRDALIANEGFSADRVGVVRNGIDLSPFGSEALGTHERVETRHRLGVTPDELVILHVARLDPQKDHATALRSFARLRERRLGVRLVIVGDGHELQRVTALIESLHLDSAVALLGERRDVPRLLAAADVLLLTSVTEGLPLAVIEAMAAGLSVVATRVGGVAEVVEDGVTGLLAPSGDVEATANQLLTLASDADQRRRMGEAGRARAQALFSDAHMLAQYRNLYRDMIRRV